MCSDPSFIYSNIVEKLCGKVIKDISSEFSFTFVITSDEIFYCWGSNICAQLGNGKRDENCYEPQLNEYLTDKNVSKIRCRAFHSLALTKDGKVHAG